jgi:hypothetical protein
MRLSRERPWRLSAFVTATGIACLVMGASAARADVDACVTASEEGLALRKQERLREALPRLAACADASCPDDIRAVCTKRVSDVTAAMPSLVFAVKDGAGNDLTEVKVTLDGAPLAEHLDGRPFALDPGEHAFTFEADGQPRVDKRLLLREGEKDRHEIIVMGVVAPPATATPAPTGAEGGPMASWSTQKSLAIASLGLGVVALGVGAGFGIAASSSWSDSQSECKTSTVSGCTDHTSAVRDRSTALTDATVATVAFGVGAVAVGAAVALWFTAPRGPRNAVGVGSVRLAPIVGGGRSGVLLEGAFE